VVPWQVTYDPVAHGWLRLRESAGTFYWETSPDGTSWTTRASVPTTTLTTLTGGILWVGNDASHGQAIFDNFSVVEVGTGVPAITAAAALGGFGQFNATPPNLALFTGSGAFGATGSPATQGSVALASEGVLEATGVPSLWHFTGPWLLDYRPLELLGPGVGLIGWIPYGKTVWRDAAGQWHEKYAPQIADTEGASVVYGGGRTYPLGDQERLDLIAGGYGDYITLQEITT
jgi:hypothetical protein